MKITKKLLSIRFIVIVLIIVYFLNICFQKKMKIDNLKSQIKTENQKIEKMKSEIDDLKEKTEKGKSLEFVESVARDDFNMVKPGEYIYIEKQDEEKKESRQDEE